MKHIPFFSVIIPTYNRAQSISTAIKSVLDQTFSNFELVVVDDGSTDNTKEVIDNFKDGRIVYIFQENKERSAARNNGIKHARGEFLCFLDSDDIYLPHHLDVLYSNIQRQSDRIALFSTGMLRLNREGIVSGHPMHYKEIIHPVKYIWKYFLLIDAVCAHRDVFQQHLFDERFRIWEDTHLWLRIAAQYPFHQIPEYTTLQHMHADSTVETMFGKLKMREIEQYIAAIDDLFLNYSSLIGPYLTKKDQEGYIIRKCDLFYHMAIRNRQFDIAYKLVLLRYKRHGNVLKLGYRVLKTFLSSVIMLLTPKPSLNPIAAKG